MKQLFLTLCAFALLVCMAMPSNVKACAHVGDDVDVGYNNGAVTAYKVATEPSPMMAQAVDHPESTAGITYTTILPAPMPETVTLNSVKWSGGDTKASRREAMLITSFYNTVSCTHTANASYEFGKDIRRLCTEANTRFCNK